MKLTKQETKICNILEKYADAKRSLSDSLTDMNDIIKQAIADYDAKGIKAKALRKKGTDKWYWSPMYDTPVYPSWWISHHPEIRYFTETLDEFKAMCERDIETHGEDLRVPPDAELVDIIIIPQGGGIV